MGSLAATTELLQLFADPTRVRLAALLEREELSVAELTRVTELPQSRVSTHLGKLREAGILRDRRQGSSTFYSMSDGAMPADARKLWQLLATNLDEPQLSSDRERCDALVRGRTAAEPWPDSVAGSMERTYSPGRTWESTARGFVGLLHLGDVLDAGSGDGAIAELLAPRTRSLTLLDRSDKLLDAARRRLSAAANVRFAPGDFHELPFPPASFDQVLLFNALVYAADPSRVVAEVARVLRPGGDLVISTLAEHAHSDITEAYGHLHPGFAVPRLRSWLQDAGLIVDVCDITSREKREPHFLVVSIFARKPDVSS